MLISSIFTFRCVLRDKWILMIYESIALSSFNVYIEQHETGISSRYCHVHLIFDIENTKCDVFPCFAMVSEYLQSHKVAIFDR